MWPRTNTHGDIPSHGGRARARRPKRQPISTIRMDGVPLDPERAAEPWMWGKRGYAGGPRVAWVASVASEPLSRQLDFVTWAAGSRADGASAVVVVAQEWCPRQQMTQW